MPSMIFVPIEQVLYAKRSLIFKAMMVFIKGTPNTTITYKCLREREHVFVSVSVVFLIYASSTLNCKVFLSGIHPLPFEEKYAVVNCCLDSCSLPSHTL